MKHALKSLFSDNGDVSMMRVMSLMSLMAGMWLAFTGHDSCVLIFVSAAFAGKVSQKAVEK